MKLKYQISLLIITFLLMGLVFLGTSYSLWSSTQIQANENVINTPCFNISYSEESNINLTNTYPMIDSKGLTTTPYTFTVTNTCELASKMNILVNILNTTTMNINSIKIAYQEDSNSITTPVLLGSLTKLSEIVSNDSNTTVSYILTSSTLSYNESKTYKIYMWIADSVTNEEMDNIFNARISVDSQATT